MHALLAQIPPDARKHVHVYTPLRNVSLSTSIFWFVFGTFDASLFFSFHVRPLSFDVDVRSISFLSSVRVAAAAAARRGSLLKLPHRKRIVMEKKKRNEQENETSGADVDPMRS